MLPGAGSEHLGNTSYAGDHGIRRNFMQRRQYERTLVHTRVRKGQAVLMMDQITVQQQVQIQRARRVGKLAPPAVALLDFQERREQLARRKPGLEFGNGIDKIRLIYIADRRAAVK